MFQGILKYLGWFNWLAGELATGNIAGFIAGFLGVAGSCCRLFGLLPGVVWRADPATLPGTRQRVGQRCRVPASAFHHYCALGGCTYQGASGR